MSTFTNQTQQGRISPKLTTSTLKATLKASCLARVKSSRKSIVARRREGGGGTSNIEKGVGGRGVSEVDNSDGGGEAKAILDLELKGILDSWERSGYNGRRGGLGEKISGRKRDTSYNRDGFDELLLEEDCTMIEDEEILNKRGRVQNIINNDSATHLESQDFRDEMVNGQQAIELLLSSSEYANLLHEIEMEILAEEESLLNDHEASISNEEGYYNSLIDSYEDEDEEGGIKGNTGERQSYSQVRDNAYHCPICKSNILLKTNAGNIICTGLSSNDCNLRLVLNNNDDTTTIQNLGENCKRIEERHSSSCFGELVFFIDGCLPVCGEIDNDDMSGAIGALGEGKFLFCKCDVCKISEIVV